MTKFKVLLSIYLAVIIGVSTTIYNMEDDPNDTERLVAVTTIGIIKEDHKSSTSYRGVFALDSGITFDVNVVPSMYLSTKPGDRVTLSLNKYETNEASRNDGNYITKIFLFVFNFSFVVLGCVYLYEIRPKNKNNR